MDPFSNQFWMLLSTGAVVFPASAADYLTVPQAQKILFADADDFAIRPTNLTDEQIDKIKEISGVRQRNKNPQIWQARKKGKSLGWFMVDEVIGKHEYITYAAALSSDGHVLGVEILSYRETHGGQVREASWRKNFVGKTLKDPFKLDVDVPNISGATLSCRNVLDGVKRLLALQQVLGD
jgi:Na+-translocating ferredoxin:NAD+ oxidoreductase RnfG subunit